MPVQLVWSLVGVHAQVARSRHLETAAATPHEACAVVAAARRCVHASCGEIEARGHFVGTEHSFCSNTSSSSPSSSHTCHARRTVVIRMTLPTTWENRAALEITRRSWDLDFGGT